MEQALNEDEEDFWDFKGNREKSPHFEAKSKKDEFNINNKREEINNNEQEELKQQSHGHIETDEKNEGAEERSVRIEKLIKSLDKLKPTHHDRNEISDGQKSNAYSVNDDRRFDSLANENHINSVSDDHSKDGNTDATSDSDGSGSDRETHGITSKDNKRKRDLKLDDGKSKSNSTDKQAADEEVVRSQDSWTQRSNETDEAKSLNGNETFIDYGFPDEGSQLTRDSPVTASDRFEVHPPKSGAPHRSRRKTRKPNAVAKTSKRSHHGVNGQDVDNQQPVKDNNDQGESCDEIQSPKLSQEAESSGKENASTPKATQKHRSRNRKVKPMRSSSPEDLGKDGTGGETEGSRSPPRMRKELRSGDYDWSLSGNEEVRDWVKKKNRIAQKQKAEDRRKERLKKQEAEGIGLVGDQERKSVESLQRKKKPKPKQRSSSCPGDGGVSDREVLPRSKSQPRMSKELRSGGFDWSTSKNEEIRVWLKKKKRLLLKQRAEERKKEKMKKKEEEQKRKEHEEMYADSSERVSEWMKLKRRQEYLSRKRQKEEQTKAEQEKEKVMVIGRRMNYEPVLTEPQANSPEKQEESALRMDQKQENVLKVEPLLKQRQKQRRLLLNTGPTQPINLNKTLNLRIESVSKHTAFQTEQGANTIEEITLQNVATVTSLPSADKRSNIVKTPVRRLNEPVVLPRQSLSPSKVNVPTGNVRVSTEPENIKKKITYDEWLSRKKVEDERKRLAGQAAKEQGKNLEELSKSVEIKKMNLTPEKKSVPTGSRENLSKRATRPKSALRQERQPQVKLEQESVTSQQQELAENEADGATIEDVSDVNQLVAEASENSTRPSRSKETRSNESDKIAASEMVTDKVPNPYIIGGSNIPATVLRAKSPKPKVAVRPTLRSVKYQQGSWERFSNYLWDQVNEAEGAELTTSRDKLRLEPMGAEADKIETSFEKKPEKLEDISRHDEKVEASADTREESEYREFREDRSLELNSGENIEGEISKVPYRGNQVNEHLQDLEARGRNRRDLEDLLNKNEKSKLPFQTKEVDDNFHESDMRNCREVVASGLSHDKEERQMVTKNERESNSILTVETDGAFGMSGTRKENILTIIDAEDEETETELEDKTKAELKTDTRREIRMESKSEEHEERRGTEKNKERGTALPHVHFSDSEEEIVSDLEFSGSNASNAD